MKQVSGNEQLVAPAVAMRRFPEAFGSTKRASESSVPLRMPLSVPAGSSLRKPLSGGPAALRQGRFPRPDGYMADKHRCPDAPGTDRK